MQRQEIERIRDEVSCGVLEQAGFKTDLKESTRRAVKYRRGGEIAIVIHGGRGMVRPLSDRKGDVFALHAWLQPDGFAATLQSVAALAGVPAHPARPGCYRRDGKSASARLSGGKLVRCSGKALPLIAVSMISELFPATSCGVPCNRC